ncbi:hypothetical protein MMC13_006982 [Lambiella insularis]|nr:hypothetical protein [Lambiella insularis]
MTELSFAKTFLSTLDSRPIKLPADHAFDPKTFSPKGPVRLPLLPLPSLPPVLFYPVSNTPLQYTLPRMPHPMRRATQSSAPGSAPTLTVSLKSLRNPPLDIVLPGQAPTTSVLELKQAVAEKVGIQGTEKIRLLYRKKPCADSKTVRDVLGGEVGAEVEFSVMVMGGMEEEGKGEGGDVKMEEAPVAQGESGGAVLEKREFWEDLRGFLRQRVRDEGVAGEAVHIFEKAWKEKGNVF